MGYIYGRQRKKRLAERDDGTLFLFLCDKVRSETRISAGVVTAPLSKFEKRELKSMKIISTKCFSGEAPQKDFLNPQDLLGFCKQVVNWFYDFSLFVFVVLARYFIDSSIRNWTQVVLTVFLLGFIPVSAAGIVCRYKQVHPQWFFRLARGIAFMFFPICLVVVLAAFIRGEMNQFYAWGHFLLVTAGAVSIFLYPFLSSFPVLRAFTPSGAEKQIEGNENKEGVS